MPRFYRMPVFYFALALGAIVGGLRTWQNSASQEPGDSEQAASAPASPTPVARAIPVAEPKDGSDSILRTADGLRRKVLIKDLDVVCRDQPSGGVPVGPPLDYFATRFIFRESQPGQPDAIEVGPRDGPPQGWIPTKTTLEWDTRLMARPSKSAGRPPLVIYRDESCLVELLERRPCPRHPGGCPTEGEETPTKGSTSTLGLPILRSRAVPTADGSESTIFEVASLVRDQPPPAPVASAPPAALVPLLSRVEIAFVIDSTASMKAPIEAARRLAKQLVSDAAERHRDVTLRLALVEYRDAAPVFGFATRITSGFTDPSKFFAELRRVEPAKRGDGSVDEAVLDGLARALPFVPGDPSGQFHLEWSKGRAGELATKMIILLGDAPDHAKDLERVHALAARAKQAGITIATVALDRPGTLVRDERTRFLTQWRTLAEESFRPLEKESGFRRPVQPVSVNVDQEDRLGSLLQAILDDRIERARSLAALALAEAEGRLTEYVNRQGLTLDRVAPILVDMHRGEGQPHARPDPRSGGRKAPSLRRGWIAERLRGSTMVDVEILMSRPELESLIVELTQLQQAAQGTARELSDLIQIGTAAASGEAAFLAKDRGTQTFADHIRRRKGLPPARPDSLLRRTQADLLQSDDLYRDALNARLASCLATLIRKRKTADWNDPGRSIDGMTLIPYALFDF